MRRIIYASTSCCAFTSIELDGLASEAAKNNLAEGLTGFLLYGDHSFFQVLEGADEKIEHMKQRIWDDPRHRGISEFQDKPIEDPVFSDWSMGCYRVESAPACSASWPIVEFECIQNRMPADVPPEVLVFARTFFASISPRSTMLGEH